MLPFIEGKRVLECSFGTGYLLMQYADKFETQGIDYNKAMIELAGRNLRKKGMSAKLQWANVEDLPFEDSQFDTVINTMAFSGYADGRKAMAEFYRVLAPGGKLLLVDFNYPVNRNRLGYCLAKLMESAGDTLKDISGLLREFNFEFTDEEIGGFGSVHFYRAKKADLSEERRTHLLASTAYETPEIDMESEKQGKEDKGAGDKSEPTNSSPFAQSHAC